MDHINTVLQGNPNDVVLRKIGADWGKALANLVRLICLMVQ